MALDISRDDTFNSKQGSGWLFGKEVLSTGQDLGTPDTIHVFGRVMKSVFNKSVTTAEETDQGGVSFNASKTTKATWDVDTAQRDKKHIDFPETMDSKYIQFTQELTNKKLGAGADKLQYLVVACATPDGSLTIDGTNMYPSWKFTCNPVQTTNITISHAVVGSFTSQTVSGTILVGKYHTVIEQAFA